jgi:hypothetical protein
MAMNPRLLVPRATFDPDAAAYLAAVEAADGQALETPIKRAVDAFFRDTKAAGIFDALKACCILCGARTITGALVPLAGTAPTAQGGWSSGDYDRSTGMTGDGTSLYLDSNRAQDADPQNDGHVAVFVQSASVSNEAWIGNINRTGVVTAKGVYWRLSPTTIFGNINFAGLLESDVYSGGATFAGVSRSDENNQTLRAQGSDFTGSNASVSPSSDNLFVFARNDTDGGLDHSDATIAFYSIGTAVDLEDLDTAVTNLINAIGEAL